MDNMGSYKSEFNGCNDLPGGFTCQVCGTWARFCHTLKYPDPHFTVGVGRCCCATFANVDAERLEKDFIKDLKSKAIQELSKARRYPTEVEWEAEWEIERNSLEARQTRERAASIDTIKIKRAGEAERRQIVVTREEERRRVQASQEEDQRQMWAARMVEENNEREAAWKRERTDLAIKQTREREDAKRQEQADLEAKQKQERQEAWKRERVNLVLHWEEGWEKDGKGGLLKTWPGGSCTLAGAPFLDLVGNRSYRWKYHLSNASENGFKNSGAAKQAALAKLPETL